MSNINFKQKFEIKIDPSIKITDVKMNNKSEILVSLSNGSIAIYSHEQNCPECNIFYSNCSCY